jgi:hypothetical protein
MAAYSRGGMVRTQATIASRSSCDDVALARITARARCTLMENEIG